MGYLVKLMQAIFDHRDQLRDHYRKKRRAMSEDSMEMYFETDGMLVDAEKICKIDLHGLSDHDAGIIFHELYQLYFGRPMKGES